MIPMSGRERRGPREAIAEVLAEALAVFIQHGVCDLQDPNDAECFDGYVDRLSRLRQAQEPVGYVWMGTSNLTGHRYVVDRTIHRSREAAWASEVTFHQSESVTYTVEPVGGEE